MVRSFDDNLVGQLVNTERGKTTSDNVCTYSSEDQAHSLTVQVDFANSHE